MIQNFVTPSSLHPTLPVAKYAFVLTLYNASATTGLPLMRTESGKMRSMAGRDGSKVNDTPDTCSQNRNITVGLT